MDPMLPVSVGRYEILEELGTGGSATVYRARDTERGEDVALKVMDKANEEKEVARFFGESEFVTKLLAARSTPLEGSTAKVAEVLGEGILGDGPRAGQPFLALTLYPGA